MHHEQQVTISKARFEELEKKEKKLTALEVLGVDNWDGYDEAMQSMGD